MKDSPQLAKRWRYDAAFRVEALRLAGESRSTTPVGHELNISPMLLYKWQKEVLTPVAPPAGPIWTWQQQRSYVSCGPWPSGRGWTF